MTAWAFGQYWPAAFEDPRHDSSGKSANMPEPKKPLPDRLVTTDEAAAFLGVTRQYIYQHEEIPRRRVGRKLRFSLMELDEWTKPKAPEQEPVRHRKALYR